MTLLTPDNRGKTLAIWGSFSLVLMVAYLLTGWIPLVINDQGYSQSESAWIATVGHAGGMVGGVMASLLLARWQWPVVAVFATVAAGTMALLASAEWGVVGLTILIVVQGVFAVGTQNALNGSAGATYPAISARWASAGRWDWAASARSWGRWSDRRHCCSA